MYTGFQITCFSNQQFSIVLIGQLIDTFNLEVKEKISANLAFKRWDVIINKHCAGATDNIYHVCYNFIYSVTD